MQYSIGSLSKSTGCNIETIRFYEKIGLLNKADRTLGNQRRYDKTHYNRLLFILHARDLGFSIEAIRQLLKLAQHPDKQCCEADQIAYYQLIEVETRIKRLKRLRKELLRMTDGDKHHRVEQCRVIEALAECSSCFANHHKFSNTHAEESNSI